MTIRRLFLASMPIVGFQTFLHDLMAQKTNMQEPP